MRIHPKVYHKFVPTDANSTCLYAGKAVTQKYWYTIKLYISRSLLGILYKCFLCILNYFYQLYYKYRGKKKSWVQTYIHYSMNSKSKTFWGGFRTLCNSLGHFALHITIKFFSSLSNSVLWKVRMFVCRLIFCLIVSFSGEWFHRKKHVKNLKFEDLDSTVFSSRFSLIQPSSVTRGQRDPQTYILGK